MLTHEEMVGLQAEKHDLIVTDYFGSKEEYVLNLIHAFPYRQAARLAPEKRVLDLGCNTGYGTAILAESAQSIVGVDVSENAIASAKIKYGPKGLEFQVVDGDRLPFQDGEFDLITSLQVIEHIVDHERYMRELKRVLAPDGIVMFTTPNALIRLDPGMRPWNEFHAQEFSSAELKFLLNQYFPNVAVYGLFADDQLYSIEFSRVQMALENARKRAKPAPAHNLSPSTSTLKRAIKRILPTSVLERVRSVQHSWSSHGSPKTANEKLDASELRVLDSHKLFYRSGSLSTALDLLSICTQDEKNFAELLNRFESA